jgi:DNA polymerase III subunit beta
MKVRVERADLMAAVTWAAKRISTRAAMPVLSGVLLDGDGDRLTIRAGDGQSGEGVTSVPAEVGEPGRAVVPGKLLAQVLAKLPNEPVALDSDGSYLSIDCGRSSFKLRTMKAEDYPKPMASDEDVDQFSLPAARFTRMVDQVSPAASTDEARPVLTAVSLEMGDGKVAAAATDSYRLASKSFEVDGVEQQMAALVPASVLSDIAKTVSDTETSEVEVSLGQSLAKFVMGDYTVTTTLTEGSYPEWRKLMPADDDYESLLKVERAPLIDALGRVSVVAATMTNVPVMVSVADDGTVTVAVNAQETGSGDDTVPGELVEGGGFEVAYNPNFLIQALNTTGSQFVSIAFRDSLKPALMRPVADDDEEQEDLRLLLMPMRVS